MATNLKLAPQVVDSKHAKWVYFNNGTQPKDFKTFWGDLQIYNNKEQLRYVISLFCGYIRHVKEFNNPYRANIEAEDHLPTYQPESLVKCIKQIWDECKKDKDKMIICSSEDIYAIKGYYDRPDSEQDLDVGRIVQMCLMTGTNYKLKTWAAYSGGFACLAPKPEEYSVHAIIINGATIDTKSHGVFYADVLYMDYLKKQRAAEKEKRVQQAREEEEQHKTKWSRTVAAVMKGFDKRP